MSIFVTWFKPKIMRIGKETTYSGRQPNCKNQCRIDIYSSSFFTDSSGNILAHEFSLYRMMDGHTRARTQIPWHSAAVRRWSLTLHASCVIQIMSAPFAVLFNDRGEPAVCYTWTGWVSVNNWWKLQTAGKLPIILEEFTEYTPIS
jgi:hypothetical protein